MNLISPGPVHCEWVILALINVTRALQHDILVIKSFSYIEANLGWREYFSLAASPVSPCPHQCPGVATGAFASSDATCPTCSFEHPHFKGLLNLPKLQALLAQLRSQHILQ